MQGWLEPCRECSQYGRVINVFSLAQHVGSPWLERTLSLGDADSAARGVTSIACGSSVPGSPAEACSSVQVPGSTGMGVAVHGDGVGNPFTGP